MALPVRSFPLAAFLLMPPRDEPPHPRKTPGASRGIGISTDAAMAVLHIH